MYSKLTNKVVLADPSNYNKGRNGYKVCKITPHHMAAIWTGERCAQSFQNPNRNASANYCIGYDGVIVCNVEEQNRSWCSSSPTNDYQAITIEVANSTGAPTWEVSEAAWNSLVNLCVDICQRYNFRLVFDGTPNGSLTMHKMFASTACPGPYLSARMNKLADEVNARLGGTTPDKPQGNKSVDELAREVIRGDWGNGQDRVNRLTSAGYNYNAVQARVEEILAGKVSKPSKSIDELAKEVIAGQWGNGQDRVNRLTQAGYNYNQVQTRVEELLSSKPTTPSKSVDELAQEVLAGKWGNGSDRKQRLTNAGYNYNAVQSRVDALLGYSIPKMSARQFALEVWNEGKHGKGAARVEAARRLGVNYNEAQRLINILANGGRI